MDEFYPDPDEEFEMMHADDLELLDELDYNDHFHPATAKRPPAQSNPAASPAQSTPIRSAPVKSTPVRRSLNFTASAAPGDGCSPSISISPPQTPSQTPQISNSATHIPDANGSNKKRTVDEIFGDIDDIVVEEALEEYRRNKSHKRFRNEAAVEPFSFLNIESESNTAVDSENELIDRILTMRKRAHIESNSDQLSLSPNLLKHGQDSSMTKGVPKWPFVSVTSELGERIYVRIRNEEYFNEACRSVSYQKKISGLLKVSFGTLKSSAIDLLRKKQESEIAAQEREISNVMDVTDETASDGSDLWVVKYRPSCYAELLSDESTNRTLLQWLKLWDKFVFNKERKPKNKHKEQKAENRFQKKKFGPTLNEELDEYGRPYHKVVLMCGPPGLGKTTLAHMVANLAGYKAVEVNASDDRSPDAFRTQLEAATQMKAVMGSDPRPNCLVLDEIDGAPAASIEVLMKFILGKDIGKGKGKKKDSSQGILKRPVICVCNDAYVPALRPLRQLALVLHFPPTASERLATRLIAIARKQKMKTDMSAMLALCEKTQNDIRSCLSTLNYFKSQGSCIQLSDIKKSNVGLKDIQRGLFSVWQEIFQIQRLKGACALDAQMNEKAEDKSETKLTDSLLASRIRNVLNVVQSYGDYDRLTMGVFENYPSMKLRDSSLCGLVKGLDWFCTNDMLSSEILKNQNYILMPYLPYAFAVWHLLYAQLAWPKINYPSSSHEAFVKESHINQVVVEVMKGMSPCVRAGYNLHKLILDVLPLLLDIIVPSFRPVSLQLFSSQEKQELCNLVNVMIDYNLTYTQERTQEGTYVCVLDPNIEDVVLLDGCKVSRCLTYSVKQLIAREIELEKMRRHEQIMFGLNRNGNAATKITNNHSEEKKNGKSPKKGSNISPPTVPNHLRKLKPKAVIKDVQLKDFFGRIVTLPVSSSSAVVDGGNESKGDIWFHFKEGFNNAVRKTVRMSTLM